MLASTAGMRQRPKSHTGLAIVLSKPAIPAQSIRIIEVPQVSIKVFRVLWRRSIVTSSIRLKFAATSGLSFVQESVMTNWTSSAPIG
jgi:hypothetical protein